MHRPDGHEREERERLGRLFVRHFGRGFALVRLRPGGVGLLRTRLGSTLIIFLPGFRNAPALFRDVFGAGDKLDEIEALAVVEAFNGSAAGQAYADAGLAVSRTLGLA